MSIEVKVPQLPESVTDATLVTWHKRAGDPVRRDENLVDLETDKVVLEVPAPSDGVLTEIKIEDGASVTMGQVLAVLEPGQVPAESASQPSEKPLPRPPEEAAQTAESVRSAERLGPAARRLIEEHDLDPAAIVGTGREGRVTKSDVLNYLKSGSSADDGGEEVAVPAPAAADFGVTRAEQRVPMSRLRARIAERLVEAQHTAAMLTTFNEVDMTAVMSLRKRYQDAFQARYGIKLGFMSFFVKASIEALRRFPVLNASLDEGE
ncbi:MAG: 2-oxo acid dehydrogenase subunit E2, partial [Gammaproteobacteria bacterium]|nr:2-oxo acid dehydrogenase subunit E2 [Gammaproteobacteria bacterium]